MRTSLFHLTGYMNPNQLSKVNINIMNLKQKKQKYLINVLNYLFFVFLIITSQSCYEAERKCNIDDLKVSTVELDKCKSCHGYSTAVVENAPSFMSFFKFKNADLLKNKFLKAKSHEFIIQDLSNNEIKCITEFITKLDSTQD